MIHVLGDTCTTSLIHVHVNVSGPISVSLLLLLLLIGTCVAFMSQCMDCPFI